MPHLLSTDALDAETIARLFARAIALSRHGKAKRRGTAFSLATLFLETSLRTRLGFAEACIRLGGVPVDLQQPRGEAWMSAGESFEDSLRVLTGMADLVVMRTPFPVARDAIERQAVAPVINGGNGAGEHPSQALIDAAFLQSIGRCLTGETVCLCGDLGSRVANSSLKLFARLRPAGLILASPASRRADRALVAAAATLCPVRETETPLFGEASIISMIGLPRMRGTDVLEERARAAFRLTRADLAQAAAGAIVLSPLPNIDEIAADALDDPRILCFHQSDFAVFVRMAIIEYAMDRL